MLSEDDVRDILRKRCEATSQTRVAREFGVSDVFIHNIVKKNGRIGSTIPKAMGLTRVVKYIPCNGAKDVG